MVTAPHSTTVLHAAELDTHKWLRWRALHHVYQFGHSVTFDSL